MYNFRMDAKRMVTELRGLGMSVKQISRALGCRPVSIYAWQFYGVWPSRKYARKLTALYEEKIDREPRQ